MRILAFAIFGAAACNGNKVPSDTALSNDSGLIETVAADVDPGANEDAGAETEDVDTPTSEDIGTDSLDDDGDGVSREDGDCDDTDATIHPSAVELVDGVDQDCNGLIDDRTDAYDDDGDGRSEDEGDCDDRDAGVHPGAVELVDGVDQDCNGLIDDRTDAYDDDGDGRSEDEGDCDDTDATIRPGVVEVVDGVDQDCNGLIDDETDAYDDDGDGVSEEDGDCDDRDAGVYPGAVELVDGVDQDCNGLIDDETDAYDDDGDGVTEDDGDCDDRDAGVHPGVVELVDGVDQDCNGLIDDSTDAYDDDGDGVTEDDGDCDDRDAGVHPGAVEICDAIDNDCDREVDEDAIGMSEFFLDSDGDGYGDEDEPIESCTAPAGYVSAIGDCDDNLAGVNPDANEACDDMDTDCDGEIDEEEICACADLAGGSELGEIATGSIEDHGDGYESVCAENPDGRDISYAWTAPYTGAFRFSTAGSDFDTVLMVMTEYCEEDLACNDDTERFLSTLVMASTGHGLGHGGDSRTESAYSYSIIDISLEEGETVVVVVDSNASDATGTYELSVGIGDGDGDGLDEDEDCDDTDASVTTGFTYYIDLDGDGYGVDGTEFQSCSEECGGLAAQGGDCNDENADVHPGAGYHDEYYLTGGWVYIGWPVMGDVPESSYDYNCSGDNEYSETRESTDEHCSDIGEVDDVGEVNKWIDEAPACGQEGEFLLYCDRVRPAGGGWLEWHTESETRVMECK